MNGISVSLNATSKLYTWACVQGPPTVRVTVRFKPRTSGSALRLPGSLMKDVLPTPVTPMTPIKTSMLARDGGGELILAA